MFKKREVKGKGIRRKRETETSEANASLGIIGSGNKDDNEEDDESGSAVIRDDIGNSSRKRVNKFSNGIGNGGFSSKKNNNGNENKKNENSQHLGALLAVESEGNKKHVYGGSATATNDVDTEADHDARAIAERNLALQKDGGGITEDGTVIYRGQAGYKNYIAKDESSIGNNKNTGTQGPIRAPAFFRATCRFDYQPDICKDYKDTGYCGFGDSCKFMHDRGNYKSGYQMEKEWDEKQAERKRMIAMGIDPDEDKKDDDDEFVVKTGPELPFACFICRGPFKDPIQTICQHYFCQNCAVKQFRSEGPNCPICTKNTGGIFNGARKLNIYANTKGGYLKLFNDQGGGGGAMESSTDINKEKTNSIEKNNVKGGSSSSGGWSVVDDDEEEGEGQGVGDLLNDEMMTKQDEKKSEKENQNEKNDQNNSISASSNSTSQESKLYDVAKTIGWYQVNAHGQTYWYNQTSNMTSRETPAEVLELMTKHQ